MRQVPIIKMKKRMLMPIFVLLVSCLSSCKISDKKVKQEDGYCFSQKSYDSHVVSLNNKATSILRSEMMLINKDTQKTRSILSLLDSAIAIDSTYYIAYCNKASLLFELHRTQDAIQCMKLITDQCEDYAEGNMMIGTFYEILGEIREARVQYIRSLRTYQKRNRIKNKLLNRQNEIFLYFMLDEKDSAASIINNLSTEFPSENSAIDEFKKDLKVYDKEAFIKSIVGSGSSYKFQ